MEKIEKQTIEEFFDKCYPHFLKSYSKDRKAQMIKFAREYHESQVKNHGVSHHVSGCCGQFKIDKDSSGFIRWCEKHNCQCNYR